MDELLHAREKYRIWLIIHNLFSHELCQQKASRKRFIEPGNIPSCNITPWIIWTYPSYAEYIIFSEPGQCHCCWCPGSLCHQQQWCWPYSIDEYLPLHEDIFELLTQFQCKIGDEKYKNILMFPQNKSACEEFTQGMCVSTIIDRYNRVFWVYDDLEIIQDPNYAASISANLVQSLALIQYKDVILPL